MTDLSARLRNECRCGGICLRCQAAAHIEELEQQSERVENELAELCNSQQFKINDLEHERDTARRRIEELEGPHDWPCGCGHWNGPGLAVCAACGRTPIRMPGL